MLVPLLLPFQITSAILIALTVAAIAVAPAIRIKRVAAFFAFPILAAFAFPFLFPCVMHVVDSYRYGTFEYAVLADVKDPNVDFCLPREATELIINKQGNCFRAQYKISETDFNRFLNDYWERWGTTSAVKRGKMSTYSPIPRDAHELRYGELRWQYMPDAEEYFGPTASDGGGFVIWYSKSRETAYQYTGYW